MKTQINKTTASFLTSSYNGDGKYYTTVQGSRTYGNSVFQNFSNRNSNTFTVIGGGNDAPRGGKTGNFVTVEFTEDFKKLAKDFLDKIADDQAKENESLAIRDTAISNDIKNASAIVDEQYQNDVESANLLVGKEKSEARKQALINLLNRNKLDVNYFYEVMRAI